uniref:Uncharacterized protein n=1 Tax=Setaria digitata TaxID=48799 RepID=A0A915PS41_9BILA
MSEFLHSKSVLSRWGYCIDSVLSVESNDSWHLPLRVMAPMEMVNMEPESKRVGSWLVEAMLASSMPEDDEEE